MIGLQKKLGHRGTEAQSWKHKKPDNASRATVLTWTQSQSGSEDVRYVVVAANTPRMYAIDSIIPGSGALALISYSRPTCP